ALHDRPNPLSFTTVKVSVEQALQKAGITLDEINFFEYHDAFSIFAALSLEAAGFAAPGEGWKLGLEGGVTLQGRIPAATMGGLKARGNPGGASGAYQAVEAVLQLRGSAGPNQLNGAKFGMIQSLGGPASTVVTHILERLDS